MIKEEWRTVEGWPYSVSNLGRIRRDVSCRGAIGGKILQLIPDKDGYSMVILSNKNIQKKIKVHRLVCEIFHGPPPFIGAETRHLDGIRNNNISTNLKWGNRKENVADSIRHGSFLIGERHPRAKLTQQQAEDIRKIYKQVKIGRINTPCNWKLNMAKKYNVSIVTIDRVCRLEHYK